MAIHAITYRGRLRINYNVYEKLHYLEKGNDKKLIRRAEIDLLKNVFYESGYLNFLWFQKGVTVIFYLDSGLPLKTIFILHFHHY